MPKAIARPSITETLIERPACRRNGRCVRLPLFVCPGRHRFGLFCFLPNPNLRPEVGKNKEDRLQPEVRTTSSRRRQLPRQVQRVPQRRRLTISIWLPSDAATFTGLPPFGYVRQFYQYQNIAQARIEGVEAETMYDAGLWYVGVAGHLIRGKNVATNIGLCDHHAAQDHHDRRRAAARPQADPGGAVVLVRRQQRHARRLSARDRV